MATPWRTTEPPHNTTSPVKIKYQDSLGNKSQGLFIWSKIEKTWVEVNNDPDGVALYKEDGWKVMGWRPIPIRRKK